MKFTVTRNHLMIALYVLGGSLILFGLLKLLFKLDLGPEVEKDFPMAVMVGAAVLFVWNRDLWKKEERARMEEEAQKKALEEASVDVVDAVDPKNEPSSPRG